MPKQLLVVNLFTNSILESVRKLRKYAEYQDLEILLLTQMADKYQSLGSQEVRITVLPCDFANAAQLEQLLKPYLEDICAVICRGDKHIQYMRQVLPILPTNLPVPSVKSLQIATDKRMMREAFAANCPEITPAFAQVTDNSQESIDRVESKMRYPVIVKPTSLVSSMLIQSCQNQGELQAALTNVFAAIDDIYQREERHEPPEVIVEEFMEGDFYSIDAFVLQNQVFCCPPVAYLPAKSMGIDDFFLYKRWLPANLTPSEVAAANEVCRKAIFASGLQYSVAHVELILTPHGWRVIELGPRLGRFRQTMYRAGYGIDHSMNDVLVRLGQPPIIPTVQLSQVAAYSIYADTEGKLDHITKLEEVENLSEIVYFKNLSEHGDVVKYAKNGGKALLEFIISSADQMEFKSTTEFIEKEVKAIIY